MHIIIISSSSTRYTYIDILIEYIDFVTFFYQGIFHFENNTYIYNTIFIFLIKNEMSIK